jgi:hypothetical protein
MTFRPRLIPLVAVLAFVGAGCAVAPTATPAEGPSAVVSGFQLQTVAAAVNVTAGGPRCLNVPASLSQSTTPRDSNHPGTLIGGDSISCTDPGDGTALRAAWSAGIAAELSRLHATIVMTGTGDGRADEWGYTSNGISGNISFKVLPASAGQFWVVIDVFEAF